MYVMKWLERLTRRQALADVTRKVQEQRHEIERLRARLEVQQKRLLKEKRKRQHLEKRVARRKKAAAAVDTRPPTPHRLAFQHATAADDYRFATVISYPKSGRTWFSTIYFHYARLVLGATDIVQQSLHMPDRNLQFQQLLAERSKGGRFPVCVFTHLGFSGLKPFESEPGSWPDKAHTVLKRPTVLIVRNPRDVVVSHYHHLRAVGGVLQPDLPLSEFIRGPWGITRIVKFMNLWAEGLEGHHRNLHLCTYESMKRDTVGAFSSAMASLGDHVQRAAVMQAVEESSFEKLRSREQASRAYQGASLDRDAFRFRRGSVGGYSQELTPADAAYLDDVIVSHLAPVFGYRADEADPKNSRR
jgi:hypothetical protein